MIKSILNKINFNLGFNPKIEKRSDWRRYVPEPYKSVLLIGADFELAWAWQYSKSAINNPEFASSKARQERKNIPILVHLCDNYSIPVTWATVGHLFLESCDKSHQPHSQMIRPPYFENEFWRFSKGDWYQNDPCANFLNAPEWYCPDLIKLILNAKVMHEIGCHTFSHIDCRDVVCSKELLKCELDACIRIAKGWNIELKSFVHPGYTIGNLDTLSNEGFTNFRTNNRNVLTYPKKHKNNLWEFEQTTEFVYRPDWSIDYHIYRYKKIIDRAIKSNTLCYFWFHPSMDSILAEEILPSIFEYINHCRDQIFVTTHNEYVEWLEKNETH